MRIVKKEKSLLKQMIFAKNNKNLELIINALFYIGVKAVEYRQEEIIKDVSNQLGWMAARALEDNNITIFIIIVKKATAYYNLTCDYNIEKNIKVFIGTLFIILGALTLSRQKMNFLSVLIQNIKNDINIKNKIHLQNSKSIRVYTSSEWDEKLNNKASYYMEEFYKKIK